MNREIYHTTYHRMNSKSARYDVGNIKFDVVKKYKFYTPIISLAKLNIVMKSRSKNEVN